jgi:transcriptional regulator with XRE-family HTH domain
MLYNKSMGNLNSTPEKLRKALSANIKGRRKILSISQEKLAEIADLSAQTVNDIEGCRMWVSDKTMSKLSQALGVEAYQLLVPNVEKEVECTTPSSIELLCALQENLKNNIDVQFDKIFKSGTLR